MDVEKFVNDKMGCLVLDRTGVIDIVKAALAQDREEREKERKTLLKYIKAQQDLLVAYRIGGRPKEKTLDYLNTHRAAVDAALKEIKKGGA